MPNIILKTTRFQAIEIHNVIANMSGEAAYKAARQQLQKAILTVWPEVAEGDGRETPVDEVRSLELNSKHQRAMAEGFLAIAGDPKTTNRGYDVIQRIAGICMVWGWVASHIAERSVPDFDGELDGEAELLDPVF